MIQSSTAMSAVTTSLIAGNYRLIDPEEYIKSEIAQETDDDVVSEELELFEIDAEETDVSEEADEDFDYDPHEFDGEVQVARYYRQHRHQREMLDRKDYYNGFRLDDGWKCMTKAPILIDVRGVGARRKSTQWAKRPLGIGRRAAKRRAKAQQIELRQIRKAHRARIYGDPEMRAELRRRLTEEYLGWTEEDVLSFFDPN